MLSRLAINPFKRLRNDEGGLSMVEVMVAALLLVLGSLALFQIVDAAARTSYRAEQSQVSSNLLQRELERVKGAAREDFMVSPMDANGCMGDMPEEFSSNLSGGDWSSSTHFDGEQIAFPMLVDGTEDEGFAPCEPVVSGDVTATVYRSITWFDPDFEGPGDECFIPEDPADLRHDDSCGMHRITIGVVPDTTATGGERGYREIQGEVLVFKADANFDPDGEEE